MEQLKELTSKELKEILDGLTQKYEEFSYSYLGMSLLSRPIPIITLGDKRATKSVLYVGTHHATENICTNILLRLINDYFCAYKNFKQLYSINSRYLYKMRKIHIIPMLNPDGVEYRLNGIDATNPLYQRVLKYNENETDFSKWNANARGVDLNHNYNAGFTEYKQLERERGILPGKSKYSGEFPESEPEVSALCNFIRFNQEEIQGVISLHTQGEEIYYTSGDIIPKKSKHIAEIISKMTGYKLSIPEDTACYGGLTDWLIREMDIPAFTLECGLGQNPLDIASVKSIYARIKELLFTFPILF